MKKIFVTGATGFVGKRLIPALVKREYLVVAFLLPNDPEEGKFPKKNLTIKHGDIRNQSSIEKAIKDTSVVIHLAAVQESNDQKLNEAVNFQGLKNLLRACKKHNIRRLIHLSSIATRYKKKGHYGLSKEKAERYIMNSQDVDFTILRPTLIFGPPVPGPFHTFLKTIRTIPLIIPIIDNGKALKQPVYVDDVVRAIILTLESKKAVGKLYNLSGLKPISVEKMIDLIIAKKKVNKIKIKIPAWILSPLALILEQLLVDPPFSRASLVTALENATLDHSLISKELGFKPLSFRQGLDKINLKL